MEPTSTTPQSWNGLSWHRILFNTWIVEIAALVFSTACLVAIAIVLGIYHGKTQPQLPYGLTLNAIIAVLATGSKSSLIFAVAAALGQLKWVWFRRSQKLQHVQLFDDASRGPWGSLSMLKSINVRSMASIGALVTVLALAFEPFVQQILKYPVVHESKPDTRASLKKKSVFNVDAYGGRALIDLPSYQLDNIGTVSYYRTLQSGLWSTEDGHAFQQTPKCPTGTCHWPVHRSSGLCTRCADAKAYASMKCSDLDAYRSGKAERLDCYVSYGHGNAIDVLFGHTLDKPAALNRTARTYEHVQEAVWVVSRVTVTNRGQQNHTHPLPISQIPKFHDIPDPGLVLGRVKTAWGRGNITKNPVIIQAEECIITHCAMDYNVSVSGGEPNFEVLRTHYGSYSIGHRPVLGYGSAYELQHSNFSHVCWQAEPGKVNYELSTIGSLPTVDQTRIANFEIQVNDTYNAICPVEDQLRGISKVLTGIEFYKDVVYGQEVDLSNWIRNHGERGGTTNYNVLYFVIDILAPGLNEEALPGNGLEPALKRIAASLTKLSLDVGNETVYGNATFPVLHVHVEWAWLGLPIALEILGIIFLAIAMLSTRLHKAQLWKSSVLPLLLHGLDEDRAHVGAVPSDVLGMEQAAEKMQVRLNEPGEQARTDDARNTDVIGQEGRLLLAFDGDKLGI